MDDFTIEIVEVVYTDRKQGDKPVLLSDLVGMMQMMYVQWRDFQIDLWATATLERVPVGRLVRLADAVMDQLWANAIYESYANDGNVDAFAAYGIALLRWINQRNADRVPTLQYTHDELQAWLDQHNPLVQLSLF